MVKSLKSGFCLRDLCAQDPNQSPQPCPLLLPSCLRRGVRRGGRGVKKTNPASSEKIKLINLMWFLR